MTKPRVLGDAASIIVSGAISRVGENQALLIDAINKLYNGDKKTAAAALKTIAANEVLVFQVLTMLRAGDIRDAEDMLIEAKLKDGRR